MTQSDHYGLQAGVYDGAASSASSASNLADEMLRGRSEALSRIAGGLEALVAERQRLRDDAISAIRRDELLVSNLRLALYRPGVPPSENPAYIKLRSEELRLAREYRQALIDHWRDTALLAKDLVESIERSREATRAEDLILGGRR